MSVDDLKEYLVIDQLRLDEELVRQASLFYQVGEAHTIAIAERDGYKEVLSSIDAEVELAIRAKGGPLTEGKVKAMVANSPEHGRASEQYLIAKEKAAKLEVLKESFQQRAKMLEHLAKLFCSNYYSVESVRPPASATDSVYDNRRKRMAEDRRGG